MNRKKPIAPKVQVTSAQRTLHTMREDLIRELDQKHPEYSHAFRGKDVTQRTLQLSGQEVVKQTTYGHGDSSDPLAHREDIVVRKLRTSYDAERAALTDESSERVQELYTIPSEADAGNISEDDGGVEWNVNTPGKRVAKPKDPRDINNEGGM
jgi:hypothetical protein